MKLLNSILLTRVIISLVFVFALNNSAKAQLELPKGADDILKEIAELLLDGGILGCELNNNILGLRTSDYLSVKYGVEANEETRDAVLKIIALHTQNILKNNPDYPIIIKRNGNCETINARYKKLLDKLKVELKFNVDDYDNVQHALLYSLRWELEVQKMLEWEEFKNAKVEIDTVLKKIAAELRTNHQESFSSNNCQQMLKLFSSVKWRSYIGNHRSIEAVMFSSGERVGRLVMRQILLGKEPKLPFNSKETKSKMAEALEASREDLEKGTTMSPESLASMERLLMTKLSKEKAMEAIKYYRDESHNMIYAVISLSFSNEELESMIKLNKHPKSVIVKDKNDVLGEVTFTVISSMIESLQK